MDNANWKYVLQLEGVDYRERVLEQESHRFKRIHQNRYFNSIQEAFESLCKIDIREYDKNITGPSESGIYYRKAVIASNSPEGFSLLVNKISFEDSPEGLPVPGIYLHFPNEDMIAFQHETGYDFSGIENYDPDVPFVLMGKLTYTDRYQLTPDPFYEEIAAGIKIKEDIRSFEEGDWHFQLHIKKSPYEDAVTEELQYDARANGPLIIYNIYHYLDLKSAFYDLIKMDVASLDKELAYKRGIGGFIEQAGITDIHQNEMVKLVCLRNERFSDKTPEPGIYLKFSDINMFEDVGQINLTSLRDYEQQEPYQLILNYNRDYNELMPTEGYLSLLSKLSNELDNETYKEKEGQVYSNRQQGYILQMQWEKLSTDPQGPLPAVNISDRPFLSIRDAFDSLCGLEDALFDKSLAADLGYSFYVRKATLFDNTDFAEVMSKFLIQENTDQRPSGVYVQLNEEKLSVEVLKATHQHLTIIEQASSFNSLLAKIKLQGLQDHKYLHIDRKLFRARRYFPPGGETGLSI